MRRPERAASLGVQRLSPGAAANEGRAEMISDWGVISDAEFQRSQEQLLG